MVVRIRFRNERGRDGLLTTRATPAKLRMLFESGQYYVGNCLDTCTAAWSDLAKKKPAGKFARGHIAKFQFDPKPRLSGQQCPDESE
jgi:hypothetical protein